MIELELWEFIVAMAMGAVGGGCVVVAVAIVCTIRAARRASIRAERKEE